jgi:hypothetical protein
MNNPSDVSPFFSLGQFGLFNWENCCCLKVITVIQTHVISDKAGHEGCIIGGNLMKFLADVDMLLLLIHHEIASGHIHESK